MRGRWGPGLFDTGRAVRRLEAAYRMLADPAGGMARGGHHLVVAE